MASSAPAALLFDLDNTLTPRRRCVAAFTARFARDFADPLDEFDLDALTEIFVQADRGGYNPRRAEDLIDRIDWRRAPTTIEVEEYWRYQFPETVVPRPGLFGLFKRLRQGGFKVGVVTNGGVVGQTRKIDRLGLGDFIQSLIISEAVGCKKPDAEIFALACRDLGVVAAQCWFVGDHPLIDVAGAMDAGMTGVWIHDGESGHEWPDDLPPSDYEIDSLPALNALISTTS